MPTSHPLAAILTGAEGDPKLADEDSRDRQFFLDLGGHAGRAHSSTALRTARRQRYVVTDVHPGWSAPAGRLAVLGAGSPAWTFGFGRDGLGEGSRLATTGASRYIELSFQAGVLPLEPFDPSLQPFALTLALFEFALHARVLLRRRPGGVLLAARRAHTPFIGTCAILCTPDASQRRLPRPAPRVDACRSYGRGNQLREIKVSLLGQHRGVAQAGLFRSAEVETTRQCPDDGPGRSPETATGTAPPGRRTTGARSRSSWCVSATTSRRSSRSVSRGAWAGRRPPCAPGSGTTGATLATALVDGIAAASDPGAVERRRRGRMERPEDRESRRTHVRAPRGELGLHAGIPNGPSRSAAARRPRGESSGSARIPSPHQDLRMKSSKRMFRLLQLHQISHLQPLLPASHSTPPSRTVRTLALRQLSFFRGLPSMPRRHMAVLRLGRRAGTDVLDQLLDGLGLLAAQLVRVADRHHALAGDAGSQQGPAATRPGDAGARSPTSPPTPRRSRAPARGPPARHRQPRTPAPGSARRSAGRH